MADPILPTACDFHGKCRDLLHAANLRRRKACWGFFRPALNPRTSVPEASMLTTRPLRPLTAAALLLRLSSQRTTRRIMRADEFQKKLQQNKYFFPPTKKQNNNFGQILGVRTGRGRNVVTLASYVTKDSCNRLTYGSVFIALLYLSSHITRPSAQNISS
jgi:hypothetical protein